MSNNNFDPFSKPSMRGEDSHYMPHRPPYNDPHAVFEANRGRWQHTDPLVAQQRMRRHRNSWRELRNQSEAIDAAILMQRQRRELLATGVRKV